MEIGYPKSFVELLNSFAKEPVDNYIGQGNPAANILIIGNECTASEPHYTYETKENFEKWCRHYKNQDGWNSVPEGECFDPICPWKGWIYKGNWKATNRNSSKTWNAYQEFINHLLPQSQTIDKGEQYDFWQHCFITELSTNNQSHSPQRKLKETADSIDARLKSETGILRADFFQAFPIIILACYHYKDIYDIDIEKCFNQDYKGPVYDERCGRIHEFIHKHTRIDKDGKPHLLLHTNHFCMRSNNFINAVGKVCKDFMEKYGITT